MRSGGRAQPGLSTASDEGRYALPTAAGHRREAHRLTGVLSHLSAAVAHGWEAKTQPDQPWVTFPRKRHQLKEDRAGVRWRDLDPKEREPGVTSPVRTVLDCAASLPLDAALTVADSALRAGDVTEAQLIAAAGPRTRSSRSCGRSRSSSPS